MDNAIQEDDLVITLLGTNNRALAGDGIITLNDNDTPSDSIVISKSALHLKEGGGTQTYLVGLTEDPGETVTLTVKSLLPRAVKVSTASSDAAAGTATLEFTGGGSGTWKTPQAVTVWPENDANSDSDQNIAITHMTSVASGAGTFHKATGPAVRAYVSDDDKPTEGLWATYRDDDVERIFVVEEDGGEASLPLVLRRALEDGETVAMRVRVTGGDYGTHFTAETNSKRITVTPEKVTDISFDDKGDNDPSNDEVVATERNTGVLIVTWTQGTVRSSAQLIFTAVDDGAAATGERYLEVEAISAYSPDGSAGIDDDDSTPDGVRLRNRVQTERIHILAKDRLQLWQGRQALGLTNLTFTDMEIEANPVGDTEIVTNNTTTTLNESNSAAQEMKVSFSGRPTGVTGDMVVTVSVSDPSKLEITHSGGDTDPLTYTSAQDGTALTTFNLTPVGDADFDDEVVYVYFSVSGYGDVYPANEAVRWFRVLITDTDRGVQVEPLNLTLTEGEVRGEIIPGTNPERRTNQLAVRLRTDPGDGVTATLRPRVTNADGSATTGVNFGKNRLTFTGGSSGTWDDWQLIALQDNDPPGDVADNKYIVSFTVSNYSGAPEVRVTSIDTSPAVRVSTDTLELFEGQADGSDERSRGRTYSVVLQAPPPGDDPVVVTPTLPGTGVAYFDDGFNGRGTTARALRFGASNWDSPRTVTVYPRGDADTTDDTVTITHSVTGYGSVTAGPGVEVNVLDSGGTPGLVLSNESLIVHEGSSATMRVRLASRPSSAVTLTVSGASGGLSVDTDANMANDQATLTIAPDNWNVLRTITLTAADESDASNKVDESFTLTIAASGGGYGSVSETVGVTVYDDEFDGPTFTVSVSGATSVTEGPSALAFFDVSADRTPPSNLDVTLNISESGDFVAAADEGDKTLSFTTTTGRMVHQTDIADDNTLEAAGTITATLKPGTGYRVGTPSSATVNVQDDDDGTAADVLVSWSQTDDSALPLIGEAPVLAEGDTYTVKVSIASAAPAGGVTIPLGELIASGQAADYTVPTSVTIPQGQTSATFDIEAVIDESLEDRGLLTLTLCPTASCPTGYTAGMTAVTFGVFIADPTVVTDVSALPDFELHGGVKLLAEGNSGTFTIALQRDPVVDATITVKPVDEEPMLLQIISATASDHIGVDTDPDTDGFQNMLTFTGGNSGNWSVPRTVRVYALYDDDAATDAQNHGEYTIGFLNSAASGPYKAQVNTSGQSFRLLVSDAGNAVVVSPDAVSVAASDTVEYDVQLASDPGGTVVVTPTSSDLTKATVSSALTFTSSNWSTPQQITVTGVGAGSTAITHAVTTATTAYPVSLTIEDVDVTVTGAPPPTVPVISITAGTSPVTEGTDAAFTVTATPAPAANLTVNLDVAGDSQFSPSPTGAQTVTIPTSGSVTFTVTTNDNTVDDENGSVSVAVDTGSGYTVSSTAGSANVLVHDDDATPSSITLSVNDNSVAEGDSPAPSITVTATVDGSTQFGFNQTVTVSVTPRADDATTNYVDMTAVSDFAITIPAGAASHSQSFTLTPDDDVVDETNNTVTVSGSISGDSATTINSVSITLTDDDATPTAITLSANPSTITENGGGQTITVTAAVTGTTFGVAKTVAVAVAGHDTAGAVQFSQVSNFNINIAAEAASGQNTFTLTPTDNNTVDNSGEATISGTLASATVAGASVAITDDDSGPVTVAMAATDGDANGNAVEGANNTTGYRTITINLGRALTGAETVTVPLTADGATVTTDYTFGLQPTTQTGVSLTTTGGTHTAQNPAVVFSAGASSATLRLTPVDNNDRTQPYVVIGYGTGARAPSVSGVTLGDVSGGPIGVVLVDDETGDIEVPSSWGLKPSAVARGGTFRLIYVSSQSRNAEATDIDVYNAFVQNVTATGGHARLKPYAGLAKVVGSTAATDARDNTGTTGAGVPIYWLNGAKVADDYADFYDGSWDSSQFRNESGSVAGGVFSIWTGSNADGTKNNSPLGNTSFVRYGDSRSDRNQNHLNDGGSAPDNQNRLYALSPVFTVEAPLADPVISITAGASPVTEGTAATFTVTATPAPAANLTVNLTVVQTGDFGATPTGSQTVTIPTTGSGTFTVSTTGDTVDDADGSVGVTVGTGTGYTVSSTSGSATVAVNDDDATPTAITLGVDDNSVAEGDSPAPTISVTATVDGSTQFGVAKTVRVSVTPRSDTTSVNYVDMTAVSDFDVTIPAGTASHSQSFTLTPDNDIVDESDNTVTVSGSISGDSATTINSVSITLTDDDATPTAITLSASPSTITEDGGGQTITVTAAVTGTTFGVAKTVAVAVAGHDTAGAVQFSQVSNFNINIAAEAASGQNTFTLTPTNNNTPDNDGEAAISGTLANATVAGASVTITNDDSAPVTVAMAATDGDANGNAVEGANNATGYRTITIRLGRTLTSSETVTVPLTVVGATVTTDHTLGLRGTNTGVTLTTSGTHTAQNPAVVFTSGGQTATLRLTPVDNNARTQPYVVIDYGTGARVPSVSGVTLGDVTGGPIGIVLVDDETGDIEVPSSWGLAPSGLSGGDDFRLLFRTSTGRDATSSDIAVYDAFVRGVLAGGGHSDIKPYAGFFKVLGGTRSTSGATGTAARVHNGMATAHTGHLQNGPWTDGSTRATVGNAAGVPTYWLNGAILANNYADLCDLAWSTGSGVTTGWDTDDPRNEDGTRNIPTGAISNYAPYETWTGSGNACEAYDHPLGASTVSRSSADSGGGQELLHGSAVANTGIHPFYGYSPVFKIEDTTAPSEVTVAPDWALIPSGISAGGKFRLLFVTSMQRDASATDIATYNTFVQNRAAAGHTAIRAHSAEFRVVGSTASVDARDNSATTGTGVPIYWLGSSNSNRVADNYADFYDGNWDNYQNANENGMDTGNGSGAGNATVWTGSNNNGTRHSSNPLGATNVQYGQLFLASTNAPLNRAQSGNSNSRHLYGLSPVYTVQASAVVPELTFSSATYSGAEDGGTISVTVNASSAPMSALTVNLGKTDGTATGGGVDFTNPAATFTFPASVTSHDFTVSITDDMILENHEDFTLTLQSGTGYTVGTTQASTTVTITDQDTVTVRIEDATDTVSEDDEGVTITLLKDGDADIPVQATLTPSDGTATGGSDATLAGIDYDNDTLTPIAIPAGVSSVDVEVAINDDSLAEASETFSVALTAVGGQRGVSVASPSSATVTITDNDPISVAMAGSDGDSDGNAVEGASGATGYRTITITLGQAVPGGQTVTVPLTVQGATIATDYTFGLRGTNTGVSLTTSGGTHTAQNPAVVFAAGASSATLRLTPVDNNLLSQPHVVIDYGTGGRAPSVTGGLTLDTPTGGPIGVVLVDDESTSSSGTETDPIEVPSDWPLTPSGLSEGDKFRLMFMTSEGRDASSTDIADYDAFVRRIGAGNGHQDIRPYIGYFKAFGNTRSTTATSQNVAARGHVGMWTSSSNVWTDGSTSDSSAGTPIYWLDGNQISDNYFDFCDSSWDNRWSSGTNHLKHEDGNAADGSKVWTGMNNNCTLHANALGATQTVWAPGTQTPSGGPLNKGSEANTNGNRFYAMSPVFKVETPPAPPVPPKPTGFTATAGNGQVTLSWNDPNQSSITSWKYRQKAGSGSYGSLITISGSSASTTSHTVTGLTNGVTYTFQVLAHASNAGGSVDGLQSDERTATPTATPVVIDPNAPQVVSIKRHAQEVRNLGMSLVWRVEFDKHLPNVYASDFTLTGTTAGLDVRHDLSNYDPVTYKTVVFVYAQGGDLESVSGTVTLSFASSHNIVDFEGRRLASTNPTGTNQHTFTLNPNETLVYFTQPDYYVNEGEDAVVTLKLSRLRDTATSIRLSATPLTATGNGVDYHGSTYTATIPAYRASGTFKIRTSDDTLTENEETFRVDIHPPFLPAGMAVTNAPGATGNDGQAYIRILDEDTATAKAKTEPDLVFDNAYLTWNEAEGCGDTGPTYNVKLKNRPAGPVDVLIKDPDDDYRSDYVAKNRLYVANSRGSNYEHEHTILHFTPDNWDTYQLVNVKVRCADHYTAQIPIKHRIDTNYIGDKGQLSHAYPGYAGVVDKGWTVHVKVREADPPIVAKGLPAPDKPVDVKEGGHVDFEIILSESAFEHHSRLPVYLSARGGKAAGVKRRDGSARSCGGPFDDCLYFTPENRTQWVRLFAINPGRDELKVEIPQLLWGDLGDLPLVRDWDMRWPVEVSPVSQGAPAQGAAVVPTQAVSSLQVTAIDAASASVTWNGVEHARFHEVSWEAESSDGQAVISGIESVAGTSARIRHNAQEDMTLNGHGDARVC